MVAGRELRSLRFVKDRHGSIRLGFAISLERQGPEEAGRFGEDARPLLGWGNESSPRARRRATPPLASIQVRIPVPECGPWHQATAPGPTRWRHARPALPQRQIGNPQIFIVGAMSFIRPWEYIVWRCEVALSTSVECCILFAMLDGFPTLVDRAETFIVEPSHGSPAGLEPEREAAEHAFRLDR